MSPKMQRREVITALGGAAASVSTSRPLCAQDTGRIYRLGFLASFACWRGRSTAGPPH
jgi:hypothetical protein